MRRSQAKLPKFGGIFVLFACIFTVFIPNKPLAREPFESKAPEASSTHRAEKGSLLRQSARMLFAPVNEPEGIMSKSCPSRVVVPRCSKGAASTGIPSFKIHEHARFLENAPELDGQLVSIELRVRGASCSLYGGPVMFPEDCRESQDVFDGDSLLTTTIDPQNYGADEIRVFLGEFGSPCGAYKQCLTGRSYNGDPIISVVARFDLKKTTSSSGKHLALLIFEVQHEP